MHIEASPGNGNTIVRLHREFGRVVAPWAQFSAQVRAQAFACFGFTALGCVALTGHALAQSEQDIRCMQLQQELTAARGGGANAPELAALSQEIAQANQVYRSSKSEMERAGCYERMLIFGRALKRTPRCLSMNARVEDARRHAERLKAQRNSVGSGGNRRRQQELQRAMNRIGCSGAPASGGGPFDFFGGPRQEYQTPIYRSINPNGRYRTVCVRLCDGFYYPISYSTYGSRATQDAQKCQSSCAAPAELYVYRNSGQEIEQAISLSGSAYMDLPVALRYRKEFVKGCSCKKNEYNPAEIEAANKQAQGGPGGGGQQAAAAPAQPAPQVQPAAAPDAVPKLNLEIGGAAQPELQITPPPPPAAQQAAPIMQIPTVPAAPQLPPAAQAPAPPPKQGQSSFIKKSPAAN